MSVAQFRVLKMLAETYLSVLQLSRNEPGKVKDSAMAKLRDEIAEISGADAEHVQTSFEFVADTLRHADF